MIRSAILAMTPSGVIGKGNKLPWKKLPGDLARFRRLTMGKPCIMGRKTFESLPKPLDGRLNIVVSSQILSLPPDVKLADCLLEAIVQAGNTGAEEVFIIGGAMIYNQALPLCDKLYLTVTVDEFEGDVYLPALDLTEWSLVGTDEFPTHKDLIYTRSDDVRQRQSVPARRSNLK